LFVVVFVGILVKIKSLYGNINYKFPCRVGMPYMKPLKCLPSCKIKVQVTYQ